MLKQRIDALTLACQLLALNQSNAGRPRHSLIDLAALLTINEHPQCSKADINEYLFGSRTSSKSTLDRPLRRLLSYGLIEAVEKAGAATRAGQGRRHYRLARRGEQFLARAAQPLAKSRRLEHGLSGTGVKGSTPPRAGPRRTPAGTRR